VIEQTAVILGHINLPTAYKYLSKLQLSRLTPYAEEIILAYQCGIRHNFSTTDHIFCIRQIPEKKWEYNSSFHHRCIDIKKAYDSVRWEVLCNFFFVSGIPIKLLGLTKMCLNETYNRDRISKTVCDMLSVRNCLKHGDALLPFLFNL